MEKSEKKNDSRGEAHWTPPIYNPDSFRPLPRRENRQKEREGDGKDEGIEAGAIEIELKEE